MIPDNVFPLSLNQRNIWNLEQRFPDTSMNHICTTIRIQGQIDFFALQKSVNLVLASDASLRARIVLQEDEPLQFHAPYEEESFPIYDFSHSGTASVGQFEEAMTRERIALENAPLYRFVLFQTGENSGGLIIKVHHIISDGWSQVLLCNGIGQTYLDLLSGSQPELSKTPSYELHVKEEQRYLSSPRYETDKRYWEEVLENAGEPTALKTASSAALSLVGRRSSYVLPDVLNHAIHSFCIQNRLAPFAVFYLALSIYFRRIGGADRFMVGVPIFNRINHQFKQTTGMFVSTLPFAAEINDGWSFAQFSEHLTEEWYELLRHQRFPFRDISALAEGRRLFHIAFSYQDSELLESRDASVSFSGRWHYSGYQAEQLCIHLTNWEDQRRYAVDYDYLAQIFSPGEIEKLHTCLTNILMEALANPNKPIHALSVLSPEERERVLYSFNRTAKPIYDTGLWSRFERIAAAHPARAATIWNGERLSYREISNQAAHIGAAIHSVCRNNCGADTKGNNLVALCLPRCPDLFAGMLGVLRTGNAFLVLSPELPHKRMEELLQSSGATLLITGGENKFVSVPSLDPAAIPDCAPAVPEPDCPEALAYVVYTSGSTGSPKGVEIERHSLLNLADAMAPVYGKGAVLSLCNLSFDAFMLESICALLNGRTIVLPKDEELESPQKLANLICGYGVGSLSLTPSRLSAFLRHPAFLSGMRSIESIVCGGEAFPSELLRRLKLCTNARIYNQYGPSETTVGVSIKQLNDASSITGGSPMQNCKLYVLDRWLNPLPVGVYGELYVGGACVGRGYRNAPEETERCFISSPFGAKDRLYRTGDVAAFTAEGEILLGGRRDRQVKLRGLRVEPGEVAARLASHPQVNVAAARVFEQDGQQILAAYYTSHLVDAPCSEGELLSFLGEHLPRYMVPSYILQLPELPYTSNGKLDESRLPLPALSKGGAEPGTPLQTELLALFCSVLERDDLNIESDYFLSGGDSLNAMQLIFRAEEKTGHTLRIADIYACHTVRRLSELLEGKDLSVPTSTALTRAPKQAFYPLTPIQQGIYIQSVLNADSTAGFAYHMPGAFRLWEKPDIPRLTRAFCALLEEDPIFRTSFENGDDGVVARVAEEVSFTLPVLTGDCFETVAAQFLKPFDLSKAPLLRAALWEEGEERWILLVDIHHVISDGQSTPILLKRLDRLYQGGVTTPVPLSYLDVSYYQTTKKEDASSLPYWKEQLADLPELLELPGDFSRTHGFDFRGAQTVVALPQEISQACDEYCKGQEVSTFMLFLSAFALLLSKLSGRADFVIGTPVSGRVRPEEQTICGPFIKTLPLRLRPLPDDSVDQYLSAIRNSVTGLLDHTDTSLEDLISALHLPRSTSQNALFQVMFSQRPLDATAFSLGGKGLDYLPISTGTAKMDLVLEVAKEEGRYLLQFDYAVSLFEGETVEFYGRCIETILRSMIAGDGKPLQDLCALSPQDRLDFVDGPNYLFTPYLNLPIHEMIEREAELHPDDAAVVFHGEKVTRRALRQRSCELANMLVAAGAQKGDTIGLALMRTPDLFASMLAILKAGCAYVPLLPSFPEQRLRTMLETAGTRLVLCDPLTAEKLPGDLPCPILKTDGSGGAFFENARVAGTDLVNVMYTSGSTGQPKGVMLRHSAVSNLYGSIRELLARMPGPILCTTNVVFDSFIGESLFPLCMGKTIVLADEEEMALPWKLAELIEGERAEVFQVTPARLQMCLGNEAFCRAAASLRLVLLGGEILTPQLLEKLHAVTDAISVNMYGPTEATVYMTMIDVQPGDVITIGRPLHNSRIYVLDENRRPVLPTGWGELYLAGECLAAGYISRPDLTESAFVPDPFFPGEKMYKSGDLGRLRLNGAYDFGGRRDAQVKLNGQRVELSEITGALLGTGLVAEAAVVPVSKADGAMELCAFYCPVAGEPPRGEAQLRVALQTVLPAYMVPSRFKSLSSMPLTASSKADLRELQKRAALDSEPDEPISPSAELERPAEDKKREEKTEEPNVLVAIWQDVLHRETLSADVSFFEQGGTSLGALSILSRYYNKGLVLSLSDFYEHPTLNGQMALFGIEEKEPCSLQTEEKQPEHLIKQGARSHEAAADDKIEYHPSAPSSKESAPEASPATPKVALITGATGFFGAHLLYALLEKGEESVLCTMRDGDKGRLLDTLSWYFGAGWTSTMEEKIEVLKADISNPQLGLEKENYRKLSIEIGEIYHTAADVRHYAADEEAFLQVNVEGTKNIIALAQSAGAKLYHMSTCSVSGEHRIDSNEKTEFSEKKLYIGQDYQKNLYVKSKYLAEAAVFAARESGLDARIFRLGRLVGRASDGVFQKKPESNAFYLLLQGVDVVGAIPASFAQHKVDLTPIDYSVEAVLALRHAKGPVFHIIHPEPPTILEVTHGRFPNIRMLSDEAFSEVLTEKAKELGVLLSPLLEFYTNITTNPPTIEVTCFQTVKELQEQAFSFDIPSPARLLRHFQFGKRRSPV